MNKKIPLFMLLYILAIPETAMCSDNQTTKTSFSQRLFACPCLWVKKTPQQDELDAKNYEKDFTTIRRRNIVQKQCKKTTVEQATCTKTYSILTSFTDSTDSTKSGTSPKKVRFADDHENSQTNL